MVSKEAFEEFKKIYQEKIGKKITDEQMMTGATKLLSLFHAIYQPKKEEIGEKF